MQPFFFRRSSPNGRPWSQGLPAETEETGDNNRDDVVIIIIIIIIIFIALIAHFNIEKYDQMRITLE